MTAIVGVVHGEDVFLGGDSEILFTDSWTRQSTSAMDSKVFRIGNGLLVGVSGSCREAQIIRHRLRPELPTLGRSVVEWLTLDFMDALRKAYADSGLKKVQDTGVERAPSAALLVAVAGRLFAVYTDFSWCESPLGFMAIGSGAEPARGALSAYADLVDRWIHVPWIDGPERVALALRAAAQDNAGVREPFVIMRLRGEP